MRVAVGIILAFAGVGFFFPSDAFSQSNQVWIDPTFVVPVNSRVRLFSDFSYRAVMGGDVSAQQIIRPGVSVRVSEKFSLLGGSAWFRTQFDPPVFARHEIRHWLGATFQHRVGTKLSLLHYFRAERRFFYQTGKDTQRATRLRYRAGISLPVGMVMTGKPQNYITLQYEPFLSITNGVVANQFFDMHRMYIGIGRIWTPRVRTDLVCIPQWNKAEKDARLKLTSTIFRLQFQYTFGALNSKQSHE